MTDPDGSVMRRVDAARHRLESFRARLAAASESTAFLEVFAQLNAWIRDQHDAVLVEELARAGHFTALSPAFSAWHRRFLTEQEREASVVLLANNPPRHRLAETLQGQFAKDTYDRVAEAMKLADFGRCRHIVMVGCGPFPAAAIFLHEHTQVPVIDALDIDAGSAEVAARVVRLLSSQRLRVAVGDGADFDYRDADVVYVANLVASKAAVLRRVADTGPRTGVVLLRDPSGYGRLFAECGIDHLDARFEVYAYGETHPRFLSRHVVLKRRC